MITVIQPNEKNGSTSITSDSGSSTLIEDIKTGEITEVVAAAQQTMIESIEHTITKIESNGTLVINNAVVNEVADISSSNAMYLYFGFGGWRIRRVLRSSGNEGIANVGNNAYSTLNDAWPLRETLNYTVGGS